MRSEGERNGGLTRKRRRGRRREEEGRGDREVDERG